MESRQRLGPREVWCDQVLLIGEKLDSINPVRRGPLGENPTYLASGVVGIKGVIESSAS
jgi:hypothetical protein